MNAGKQIGIGHLWPRPAKPGQKPKVRELRDAEVVAENPCDPENEMIRKGG